MRHSNNKEYKKLHCDLYIKHRNDFLKHKDIEMAVFKEMVELFHSRHNRYPTAIEFNHDNLLPSARQIQRLFGGLKQFRKDIGLEVTNYTEGKTRTESVKKILKRAKEYEFTLFSKLHKKLHKPDEGIVVEREPVISYYIPTVETYGYRRADVAIHDFKVKGKTKTIFIDFFYASTEHSFFGCVNIKRKKIEGYVNPQDIIFVSVNPEFTKDIVSNIKLPKNSPRVLSYDEFINEFGLDDTTSLIMETMA